MGTPAARDVLGLMDDSRKKGIEFKDAIREKTPQYIPEYSDPVLDKMLEANQIRLMNDYLRRTGGAGGIHDIVDI